MNIDYSKLPGPYLGEAMQRYIEDGIPPGSFLESVLVNDLTGTVVRADSVSYARLNEIVDFVHWELPGNCHGSPQLYASWVMAGGLNGLEKKSLAEAVDSP